MSHQPWSCNRRSLPAHIAPIHVVLGLVRALILGPVLVPVLLVKVKGLQLYEMAHLLIAIALAPRAPIDLAPLVPGVPAALHTTLRSQ